MIIYQIKIIEIEQIKFKYTEIITLCVIMQ
jgi:hypothetical protein